MLVCTFIHRNLIIATLFLLVPRTPRDVVPSMTSRSIMVTWDTIDCIERNGIITGYTVVFQEQGGASVPGNTVNMIFSAEELTPGTSYTFQVAGVNDAGTGSFTDLLIIFTTEDGLLTFIAMIMIICPFFLTVPGTVSNFTVHPALTSVNLMWSAPLEPNGVIISYEIT